MRKSMIVQSIPLPFDVNTQERQQNQSFMFTSKEEKEKLQFIK